MPTTFNPGNTNRYRTITPINTSSISVDTEPKKNEHDKAHTAVTKYHDRNAGENTRYSVTYMDNSARFRIGKNSVQQIESGTLDKQHNRSDKYLVHQSGNTFIYGDPKLTALASDIRTAQQGKFSDLPLVCAHGNPLNVLVGEGPSSAVSGEEFAKDLAMRLENSKIPKSLPLLVAICGAGNKRFGDAVVCQQIANETSRLVLGSSGMVYTTNFGNIQIDHPDEWKTFTPQKGPLLIGN
jgi:hypothetical protein